MKQTTPSQVELPVNPLVSFGFDWISATTKEGYSRDAFDSLCGLLLTGEHQRDNFCRPLTLLGYAGLKCGECFVGERHDGAMVQVTGGLANTFWKPISYFASHYSRIDVQATIRSARDPFRVVVQADRDMRKAKKRRGRGPKLHLDRGENGGVTAYCGRKSSRRMLRIYNKAAESGLDQFASCVRYEAVFREDLGDRVMRLVQRSVFAEEALHSVLWSYVSEVGVRSPELRDASSYLRLPVDFFQSRSIADADRKLLWLASQVRPTLHLLLRNGYADRVAQALGCSIEMLDHLKEEENSWDSLKPC